MKKYGVPASAGVASPKLRTWAITLAIITLVTLYPIRHWHWTNILCMAGFVYAIGFTTLCFIAWLNKPLNVRKSEGGGTGRAATGLDAAAASTQESPLQRASVSSAKSAVKSPSPSPAVARAIYINLLTTTKHRL